MAQNQNSIYLNSLQVYLAHSGISQVFTSYNNPKGNADTERLMRTLKEELVWIHEWKSPVAFMAALAEWVKQYNAEYLHLALQYRAPMAFEQQPSADRTQLQATLTNGVQYSSLKTGLA